MCIAVLFKCLNSSDFLEEPNHVTMTAGVEVQVLSPIQDYFSVSPSCCLYNRKKKFLSASRAGIWGLKVYAHSLLAAAIGGEYQVSP
jgi:hypothetical protein